MITTSGTNEMERQLTLQSITGREYVDEVLAAVGLTVNLPHYQFDLVGRFEEMT